MNLICILTRHHKWKFYYNHSMPRGIGLERAIEILNSGRSYGVHRCTRCGAQSRMMNGKWILLRPDEIEAP